MWPPVLFLHYLFGCFCIHFMWQDCFPSWVSLSAKAIIISFQATSFFFFSSVLLPFKSLPQSCCVIHKFIVHFSFYGWPIADIDSAASLGMGWIIPWADCKPNMLMKHLVLHLTFKKPLTCLGGKKTVLPGRTKSPPSGVFTKMTHKNNWTALSC